MGSCRDARRNGLGWRKASAGQPWYRRRAKARQEATLAATLTRAEAFVRQLQAELAEAARCHAIAAVVIGEMTALEPDVRLRP